MLALFVLCIGVAMFQSGSIVSSSVAGSFAEHTISGEDEHQEVLAHCHADCGLSGADHAHSPYQSHEMPSQALTFDLILFPASHAWFAKLEAALKFDASLKIDRPPRP
jgi:hypothetical protein